MKKELILSISILLSCIVLGGFFYVTQVIKKYYIDEQKQIEDVFDNEGNIFLKYTDGQEKQLTFTGIDEQVSLSSDNKKIVFLRNIPGKVNIEAFYENDLEFSGLTTDQVNLSQILVLDLNSMKEEKIFDAGIIKDKYIKNGSNFTDNFNVISDIYHPIFSLDGGKVYFMSSAWATSAAIFSVDINTGQIAFISDGNALDVIREGVFAGGLLVQKHKYFKDVGGSYDHYFVIDDDGNEIKDVGNYGKDEKDIPTFNLQVQLCG